MDFKFANKRILCALGFIAFGVASTSVMAQSAEYRRGYERGYAEGLAAGQGNNRRPPQQEEDDGERGGRIRIDQADYGVRGQSCDATEAVQRMLGRTRSGTISASNQLCGDPARGQQKFLRVVYRCGRDGTAERVDVREGRSATINCR